MEPTPQNKPAQQNISLKVIAVILLLVAIVAIIHVVFRINYLQQQLIIQDSQISALINSKNILEHKLQEANLQLAALGSANKFLEKNTEQLIAIRDFLQDQLNKISEQLALQEEIISYQEKIITSLNEANSKLDTVISQVGYLYLESAKTPPSKGSKGRVNVYLSPEEEKQSTNEPAN